MNEHRPVQNPGVTGDKLAKAADDLTAPGKSDQHSWVHDAIQKAYSPVNFVVDTAKHAPIGTALTALGVGVGIYGAIKMGLPQRAVTVIAEGGVTEAAGAAANAGERQALAEGTQALANAGKTMVHLTTEEGRVGIANSFKIGGRWGIFALDSAQVPTNGLVRQAASLVPRNLSAEIPIGPGASAYFKAPTPVGPFTLARKLAGVKSTPLGSIDLLKDTFIPNEIFANGAFRQATASEITKYKIHQWLLDYSIDGLTYSLAGISTAAYEYKRLCEKSDNSPTYVVAKHHPRVAPPDSAALLGKPAQTGNTLPADKTLQADKEMRNAQPKKHIETTTVAQANDELKKL